MTNNAMQHATAGEALASVQLVSLVFVAANLCVFVFTARTTPNCV
jgi:hypothetical protein